MKKKGNMTCYLLKNFPFYNEHVENSAAVGLSLAKEPTSNHEATEKVIATSMEYSYDRCCLCISLIIFRL